MFVFARKPEKKTHRGWFIKGLHVQKDECYNIIIRAPVSELVLLFKQKTSSSLHDEVPNYGNLLKISPIVVSLFSLLSVHWILGYPKQVRIQGCILDSGDFVGLIPRRGEVTYAADKYNHEDAAHELRQPKYWEKWKYNPGLHWLQFSGQSLLIKNSDLMILI